MLRNTHIRKFIATSLLLVFALSITPTKVLHYFFANHKDATSTHLKRSSAPSLSVAGFNCQCDNLVVESPFALQCQPVAVDIPGLVIIYRPSPIHGFHCADHFFFELRGPPSNA